MRKIHESSVSAPFFYLLDNFSPVQMKILHTSDWHLGQKFCERDRLDEHKAFLNWLLSTIQKHKIDVFIHAGDVFDIGNPPSYALEMYYNFLRDLSRICRNIIFTGGNHDSPSTLNAPKELLKSLNIHVVGATSGEISDERFILKSDVGEEICVVCAVPFLRDKDIRFSVSGESSEDREQRTRIGIKEHYQNIADTIQEEKQRGLPIIATGHLFAAGSEISDIEHSVVGNLGQITAETFPAEFDYVALGHIHRPQRIGGKNHIRYCGSPIPLSFSESSYSHSVIIADFSDGKLVSVENVEVPRTRQLLRFEGTSDEIALKIQNFTNTDEMPAWVEAIATLDAPNPQWTHDIRKAAVGKNLELIKLSVKKMTTLAISDIEDEYHDLQELTEMEVFKMRCVAADFTPEITQELMFTFNELLELMREQS